MLLTLNYKMNHIVFWTIYYLFIKLATTLQFQSPDVPMCLSEFNSSVQWPTISTGASKDNLWTSSPLCLDDLRFVQQRNCTENGWQPFEPPECSYTQLSFQESNQCPLGYDWIESDGKIICYLLTENQAWNNTCISAGSIKTIFDLDSSDNIRDIYRELNVKGIKNIWMPARRFTTYGPVLWTLPGKIYGEIVEFNELKVTLENPNYYSGCFSLNIPSNGRRGNIIDCSIKLPILCIYQEKDNLLNLGCPTDFYTTRYEGHQNVCFGTHKVRGTRAYQEQQRQTPFNWVSSECRGEIYTINSVEKTVLYEELAKHSSLGSSDRCLFGVYPNIYIESQMQWQSLVPFVEYVNWAIPQQNGSMITTDRRGQWHWTNDVFSCIACEQRLEILRPQITLKFDDEHLYVIVYNQQYLWRERNKDPGIKCFTNSDNELIRSVKVEDEVWSGSLLFDDDVATVLSINDKSRTVYELKTYGDGPGYYWCEGHSIPNFRLIKSPSIVAYKKIKGEIYAIMIETDCLNCHRYFDNKYIKEMAKRFRDHLKDLRKKFKPHIIDDISVENVRLMKIELIDIIKNISRIVFHVTISIDSDIDDDDEEDELELSLEIISIYKIRNYLHNMLDTTKNLPNLEFKYISLNNTEYCLPDSLALSLTDLSWTSAKIGETSAPKELCLLENGLPILRHCVGDFIYGGIWKNIGHNSQHCNQESLSPITKSLYEIDRQFRSADDTAHVISNLTDLITTTNQNSIIPADLFYISKVMQTVTKFNNENLQNYSTPALLKRNDSENIFNIYNSLMLVNENTTKLSAALNSTNILLDAFDAIINHLSSDNLLLRNSINLTENLEDGTISVRTSRLIVYVIDPSVTNVSGIALIRKTNITNDTIQIEQDDDFYNYDIKLLYTNQSAAELLEAEFLEVASFVPLTLLNRLNETRKMVSINTSNTTETNNTGNPVPITPMAPPTPTTPPPPVRIVISIYYNDLLFQEYKEKTYAKSGGKIISVSIPGYGPILPVLLPIFIKTANFTNNRSTDDVCGYWNFKSTGWSNDGCAYGGSSGYENPTVLCVCSHLTHFAYLVLGTYFHTISDDDDVIVTDNHQNALDLITLLGCSLSLMGISGIMITALVFPSWREKASSKVLLHLSAAIALQMILICFVNTEVSSLYFFLNQQWYSCVSMGALLHYSVLVAFMWMLITAYLQFMRYVRVIGHSRSSRFFLKSFIFGWGIPLVPVIIVVAITPDSYIPNLEEIGQGICYPTGYALYLGVIVPMGLIVLANLIIFILVLYNIIRGPDGKLRTNNPNERDLTLAQLRLTILLFFLLGLTWIFGFCASTQVGLVFSYLFCLTATLQGFVLFVYFIILDPITRNLWCTFLKRNLSCSKKNNDFK